MGRVQTGLSKATRQRSPLRAAAAACGVALVAGMIVLSSDFWVLVLSTAGITAIAVLALNLLVGNAGQVSFAQTAFLGVGAYSAALGTTKLDLGPVPALLLGVVASVILALAVGVPALRLRGHYLGLATLAFSLAAYAYAANAGLTNGFTGIFGIPPLGVLGLEASDPRVMCAVIWAVVFAAAAVVWLIGRSRLGERLAAIKDDEDLAATCGIDAHRLKVFVFVLSAAFGSVAGSLQAYSVSYISPELFSIQVTASLFIVLFVGGVTVWGTLIAAFCVTLAPQELSWLAQWQTTLFGVLLLLILVSGSEVTRLPSRARLALLRRRRVSAA